MYEKGMSNGGGGDDDGIEQRLLDRSGHDQCKLVCVHTKRFPFPFPSSLKMLAPTW